MLINRYLQYIVYILVCPFILISFLLEPLGSDVRIYLGVEKLARLSGSFPLNLDTVWEIKPIGNRAIFYILNVLDPFSGWTYQIWLKILVSIFVLVILFYFSKRVAEKVHIPLTYPFIMGFLGFFAVGNFVALECEYFAAILGLLILTLMVEDKKGLWIIAGFLIIPLILIKGITLFIILSVLPLWILINFWGNRVDIAQIKQRLIWCVIGFAIASAIYFISVRFLFPHSISDMFLSAGIAHIGMVGMDKLLEYFFEYSMGLIAFSPLIVIGFLLLPFIILKVDNSQLKDILLILLSWFPPILMVFIQGEFFYYHYFPMVVPAIITCCYALKVLSNQTRVFWIIIVAVLLCLSVFVAGWSFGMGYKGYAHWNSIDSAAKEVDLKFNISNEPSTLYLSAGEPSYYFNSPSACRYVLPLPLQRNTPEWNMTKYPEYWENLNCTLNYTGKYIISDDLSWQNYTLPTHVAVKQKLETGYYKVWDDDIFDIYERR